MIRLNEVYAQKRVVTAHRGFSGAYPENTLQAFAQAVALGADIVEFDVRETADGVPVILHDDKLDRTTDGRGLVKDWAFSDLRRLTASYWQGTHDSGRRLEQPTDPAARIPTLRETLELLAPRPVGLNIQVYAQSPQVQAEIRRLYAEFDLYERGFLMLGTFAEAEAYRRENPRLEICVGEDRGNLERHRTFGSTYIQPPKKLVTPEFCVRARELGLRGNMFYSNTVEENRHYLGCGIPGILTDRPDLLLETLATGEYPV